MLKRCQTKFDVLYRVMGTMYLTEPAVDEQEAIGIGLYKALVPFVPYDVKGFRARKTVWANAVDMVALLNRELVMCLKGESNALSREVAEAFIEHIREKEQLRQEKEKKRHRSDAGKKRMAKRKAEKKLKK